MRKFKEKYAVAVLLILALICLLALLWVELYME